MKNILGLMVGVMLLPVSAVWADDMSNMVGMSTPVAVATPVVKSKVAAKVKKGKKKAVKPAAQAVWVCPMGDYSGPKTGDGKCPKCGMDLVEKK
jgi:hypothetical protein